jgi:hypothetical protein
MIGAAIGTVIGAILAVGLMWVIGYPVTLPNAGAAFVGAVTGTALYRGFFRVRS